MPIEKAIANRVFIRKETGEKVSPGGIVLANLKTKIEQDRGVVVAVGQGQHTETGLLIPCEVQEGDLVLYDNTAAQVRKIDGEEFVVITERECLAVLEVVQDEPA